MASAKKYLLNEQLDYVKRICPLIHHDSDPGWQSPPSYLSMQN